MYKFIVLLLTSISLMNSACKNCLFATANIQFISNVNDFNLNCSIRTTAGSMVALITTPQVNNGSFQIARLDASGAEVEIFLLNNATYDNIFSTTFTVDAVLKRVMVVTSINSQEHVLIYSTLNGSLLNDITLDRRLFMFAVDLYDSTIYALTVINNFVHLGSLNTNNGSFNVLVNTTAEGTRSPSQSIDFVKREYLFAGSDSNLYKINLVTFELTVIPVNIPSASYISLYNNLLYLLVSEGVGPAIKWKLGTLNISDTNTNATYLPAASDIFGFITIPRAFDFANLKMYTPLDDATIIYTYNMTDGTTINTAVMPTGYKVASMTFEQECICCLQAEPSAYKYRLMSQSVNLEKCLTPSTSSASTISVQSLMVVGLTFLLLAFNL